MAVSNQVPKLTPAYEEVAERIATALERLVARIEILTGAVLELIEKEADPIIEVAAEPPKPTLSPADVELLRALLDNARIASQPCEGKTTGPPQTGEGIPRPSSRSSRLKTKDGSVRKRGGTSGRLTQ